ncbi:MAG: hypothetical protein RJB38_2383 [Pseudomonadota bacterium]|jgi:ribosomal protein S12 methylthiotransferase accessory factor YcaO
MSWAFWSYRNILSADGGPIQRLAVANVDGGAYEAYAYLNSDLRPRWKAQQAIYGDSDGTGTSSKQSEACHIAISEALERWAFYSLVHSSDAERFGFDHEPSTSGMAAYPRGHFKSRAASRAYREALERWTISHWWIGNLRAYALYGNSKREGGAVVMGNHNSSTPVVLKWSYAPEIECMTYGFACDTTIQRALARAETERRRTLMGLRRFRECPTQRNEISDQIESRVLFRLPEERSHQGFFLF